MSENETRRFAQFLWIYFDTVVDRSLNDFGRIDQIAELVASKFPSGAERPAVEEVVTWWLDTAHSIEDAEHHLWCLDTIDAYQAAGTLHEDIGFIGIRAGLEARELHAEALARVSGAIRAFKSSVTRRAIPSENQRSQRRLRGASACGLGMPRITVS
jgi:hypothetical protein